MVNSATRDEVEHAYILAYNKGCRGITVFRDGCKGYDFQVLRRVKEEAVETTEGLNIDSEPVEPFIVSVPSHIHASRPGNTRTVVAPEGKVVVMNEDKYGLVEVFMIIGKAGSDIQAFAESLGRMVSLQLRSCDPSVRSDTVAKIAHQLRGISGSGSVGFGPNQVRSLPDALGLVLEQHQNPPFEGWIEVVADAPETPKNVQTHSYSGALCPDCGSIKMVKAEGCTKCLNCGYSKC
jgi:ribonucleoside-diphosphate reductase alpha chain